jgi:hypothetical protein
MKTLRLETEKPSLGRKPKKLKLDQKLISKLGNAIYSHNKTKDIYIKVGFKDGSVVAFHRDEEDDENEMERTKRKGRDDGDDDED